MTKKRKAKKIPAMRLLYFPTNSAWAFVFGKTLATARPLKMHAEMLFFESRPAAVAAARRRGLRVSREGFVEPTVRLVQPWD